MKYSTATKLLVSILTSLMLTHIFPVATIHSIDKQQIIKPVEQFAEASRLELAKVYPFELWKEARIHISPLGPGTHSWIAIVVLNETNVGYMIIHATEDGDYVLGEYGIGNEETMKYMIERSDTLFYHSPAQALIVEADNNEIIYLDLFNLEQLPLQNAALDINEYNIRHGNKILHASITKQYLKSYFSPYFKMPWLTSKPINTMLEDCTSIEQQLESKQPIYFVASAWDDLVQQTYSVTGYQKWGEFELYLAVQQDDEDIIRYIPFDTLMDIGSFYQ